jgi:dTDP-4-amino-4,6-dideoxygalactose transaminase
MSELQAAFLQVQLQSSERIAERRRALFAGYIEKLGAILPERMLLRVPPHCIHGGHLFPVINEGLEARLTMADHLKARGISAPFHYLPLHRAPFWKGRYEDLELPVTEAVSDGLLRLPLYFDLTEAEVDYVCDCVVEHVRGEDQ